MKVVGLTGGIGSGKSTVARMFARLGVHWVDADDVARQVVEPDTAALAEIARHFGDAILSGDGSLDRAALRSRIFENPQEREWLERLLHPIIREEIERQLHPADYSMPYVLLVSPLLFETDQHQMTDTAIVVDVSADTQIARTVSRDDNTAEQVQRIIDAQMDRQARISKADYVIDNESDPETVEKQVASLHHHFLEQFSKAH